MIQFISTSEAGGHPRNEDAFEVRPFADCVVCAIADGQGGRAGGEQAARLACRTCLDGASESTPLQLLRPTTWNRLLTVADQAVSRDPDAGFTTLVGFCVTADGICGGSCGDSALLVREQGQTEILTRHQCKNPPVGSGQAEFTPFARKLRLPWTILAMTDGVWKYAGWEHILTLVAARQGAELIEAVKDKARLGRTGELQDDFTLIVFQDR